MNHYVNLCPPHQSLEASDTVTLDIPTEYVDEFLRMSYTLSDEHNITARKAFAELVRHSYSILLEKTYERKSRKNAKR